MLPYLRLGPFLLQTTGLALLLGIWIGSWLAEKEAARLKIKPDLVTNLIFFGLVGGLIGARLAYAATYLNAYLANPLSLFAINTNTLSPVEGLLIGLLVAFVYGQRKGLQLRPVLDALAPGLAVFPNDLLGNGTFVERGCLWCADQVALGVSFCGASIAARLKSMKCCLQQV